MENFKNTIIILLLAVGLPTSAGLAKSPSLLLQEALYAEETEGNLDKAIKIYEELIEGTSVYERVAARANYQLGMCYLKKGEEEKAAEYFQIVTSKYPSQKTLVKKADGQLKMLGGDKVTERNLFEIMGDDVCSYLGNKYGEICAEAGMKRMYSNAHIYFVDRDFALRSGGMGYIYNYTGLPITGKHRLGGTSYPNQKLYDIQSNEMDVEIVPDELRDGFYHIYWNPKEPLENGEFFNYGWVYDGSRQLSNFRGGTNYSLTMQNQFGSPSYETFFLVLPEDITIADKSEEYTKMKKFGGYDIYWWKKQVQAETNHRVDVVLKKEYTIIADELPIAELRSKDESATKEYIKSALGQPDKETEKYLDYKDKYGLGFFVDGYLKEIHIEPGFKGRFLNGLTMQSTTEEIFRIFGEPVKTVQTDDLRKERKHKVLYRRKDGVGRISYDKGFFAFWLKGDNINQIVVSSGVLKGGTTESEVSESAEINKLEKEKAKSPIDLSTPEATIKSFVKAVYEGNLEVAKACVSKDGHDYDEFKEMLATESNHPFQAMIKAMDASIPVEITSKDIAEDRCKIKWYFTLGRVYYFGDTKMKKGTHQKFGSYLELVGDKWLIRDI